MDKNQAIGLLLISVLLIIYFQFFAPTPAPRESEPQQTVQQTDTAREKSQTQDQQEEISSTSREAQLRDSLEKLQAQEKFGIFAEAKTGEEKEIRVENEDVIITFSSRGGKIKSLELKKYETYKGEPLVLLREENSQLSLIAQTNKGDIDLHNLYYQTNDANTTIQRGDTTTISFTINLPQGGTVAQTYTIAGRGYQIDYALETRGMQNVIQGEHLTLDWRNKLPVLEQDMEESRRSTTFNYYTQGGSFDNISSLMGGSSEEQINEPLKWISMKQRFFSSAIIAENTFLNTSLSTTVNEQDSSYVKAMHSRLNIPYSPGASSIEYIYFFGPNNYQEMRRVTAGFAENVDLGWPIISWINKYAISYTFHFLENYITNYGIIIIILVFLIKTILFPLSYKSYVSMAKMKVLKPEIDEIKEKHKEDMQKAQQEQMQLFQRVGVSPLSGCIPMLLQLPILLAMFHFFPNSIELRQEPFLWADDLSTYDSILDLPFTIPLYGDHVSLFTLLMTASTILYTWSNNQASAVQGPMKSMQYFLPLVFMFVLNSFPAALSFYYFVSNLVTFGQQAIIRQFIDEEKIKVSLEENKKRNKNKKKSKFQQRLEDAMKASEEAKKQKKK